MGALNAITYEGPAEAEFENPPALLRGHAKVVVGVDGTLTSNFHVADVLGYDDSHPLGLGLMNFFKSDLQSDDLTGNRCIRFEVRTAEGVLESLAPVRYGYTLGRDIRLQMYSTSFRFSTSDEVPTYWMMALVNFLGSYSETAPELNVHPLRFTPSHVTGGEAVLPPLDSRLLVFQRNGEIEFIQPVPGVEELYRGLKRGDIAAAVTATMVGNVAGCSVEVEDLNEWFPFDLVPLLSIASGSSISYPWIEFFTSQGTLVQRIHWPSVLKRFDTAHVAIDEWVHRGTGYLLTRALASIHWDAAQIRICMANYIRGSCTWVMDDRLGHFARALDGLCEHLNVATQNLLDDLSPTLRDQVQQITTVAAREVRSLQVTASGAETATLSRIADRVQGAHQKERAFGLAVVKLLEVLGLPDARVMEQHFQRYPRHDGANWPGLLSRYRAAPLHGVPFMAVPSDDFMSDLFIIGQHMQDLLLRILFKMFDYDHVYQPPVAKWPWIAPVDWLSETDSASRLGY